MHCHEKNLFFFLFSRIYVADLLAIAYPKEIKYYWLLAYLLINVYLVQGYIFFVQIACFGTLVDTLLVDLYITQRLIGKILAIDSNYESELSTELDLQNRENIILTIYIIYKLNSTINN